MTALSSVVEPGRNGEVRADAVACKQHKIAVKMNDLERSNDVIVTCQSNHAHLTCTCDCPRMFIEEHF